jgi:hypothetical protein
MLASSGMKLSSAPPHASAIAVAVGAIPRLVLARAWAAVVAARPEAFAVRTMVANLLDLKTPRGGNVARA